MQTVSKSQFEAFIETNAPSRDTETETDIDCSYENFLDMDGETIAFITYRGGEAVSYHIAA